MSAIYQYQTTEAQRCASAKWRAKNIERERAKARERARKKRADDPEYVARINARSRAKHRERRYQDTEEWRARPESIELVREYNRKRREHGKKIIEDEKSGRPCADCGQVFPTCAMDFHHRDPNEKSGQVSNMASWSAKRIRAEIAKCDLLCAVCHRIRHHAPR